MNTRNSQAMNRLIAQVKEQFKDEPRIGELFENCYRDTLDTTIKELEDGTTYVITGDIPAMWLRDSAAQLRPYMILASRDEQVARMMEGLVRRQFRCIHLDPYANAFNQEESWAGWEEDETERNGWVWERKYEIDSLCYPVQLAYLLWKNTGRTGQFDQEFEEGAGKILQVFRTEQAHEENSSYYFRRKNTYYQDTLSRDGKGALVKSNVGLIWSGFRPSDDACDLGYLIPSNMFASVILGYLTEIARDILHNPRMEKEAEDLKKQVEEAIETIGITKTMEFGEIYAYETDGFGQYRLMDDANVPSLLSMSYLGYRGRNQKIEENTRKFLLSSANPYYYQGKKAKGIGSIHTPADYIWHIALAMEGLTAKSREEKLRILRTMADTDAGKGLMHEGFHKDDDTRYTREWFSWANAMFSELVLDYLGYEIKK